MLAEGDLINGLARIRHIWIGKVAYFGPHLKRDLSRFHMSPAIFDFQESGNDNQISLGLVAK